MTRTTSDRTDSEVEILSFYHRYLIEEMFSGSALARLVIMFKTLEMEMSDVTRNRSLAPVSFMFSVRSAEITR